MDKSAGYARVMARRRVARAEHKPILGKPYLRLGECLFLGAYFFQMGGILGARYSAKLDAFGPAFLGVKGDPGAVKRFFLEVAAIITERYVTGPATVMDYITRESMERLGYSGHFVDFLQHFGFTKVTSPTAGELLWQHAESGAAFGATHPDRMRRMYERANEAVSDESWRRARAAGLAIPAERDVLTYQEAEAAEAETFMLYCRECRPDLLAGLLS